MKKTLFSPMLCGIFALSACSSTPNRPKVDDSLDFKGSVDDKSIGFNHNNEAIIQESTDADQELRTQEWVNNKLREDLSYERHQLQRCRDDLADPRLGGHGFASEIPEFDDLERDIDEERIGVNNEGDLKVVRRESYVKRLQIERKKSIHFKKMIRLAQKSKRECEQKMRIARIKFGLSPTRYEPQGYFDQGGNWVITQSGEETLDDAFAIAAKQRQKKSIQ